MRYMNTLTSQGYTPVQAAGIVGNAQYESANFTAHEEFAPNAYGTRGAGVFSGLMLVDLTVVTTLNAGLLHKV